MRTSIRSRRQDQNEIKTLNKSSKEYTKHMVVFDEIKKIKQKARILEIGCGNGIILDLIQKDNPKSMVFGLDISPVMINATYGRNKEIIPIKGNAIDLSFADSFFDIVIFSSSFHEIYSFEGRSGAVKALKEAYRVLNANGTIIINEGFKVPGKVQVTFERWLLRKLEKFAKDFKLRKIRFKKLEDSRYELSKWDFYEFLTKYNNKPIKYRFEMSEEHFCFTEKEFLNILKRIGFNARRGAYAASKLQGKGFATKKDNFIAWGLIIGKKWK